MAFTALVNQPDSFTRTLDEVIQALTQEHGRFELAMLVPAPAPSMWILVVSAKWADSMGTGAVVRKVMQSLNGKLSAADSKKLFQISVLETGDPLVQALSQQGAINSPSRLVHSFELDTRNIEDSIVLVA